MTLEDAIELACNAHAGQTRRDGSPYILHPLRVMMAVSADLRIPAVLHDAVEDGGVSMGTIKAWGASEHDMHVIDLLTRKRGTHKDYWDYLRWVVTDPSAVEIKLADMDDNYPDATPEQRAKYDRARDIIHKINGGE